MKLEIWLKQGKEKIKLPFLPDSYEIQVPQNNETLVTANGTEITLIGKGGLRTISWSSWFPKGKPNYIVTPSYTGKPMSYIRKLGKMKGKIVELMISGIINCQTTIESLTYGQNDGTGDIYYSIELREYRGVETKSKEKKTKEVVSKNDSKVKKPATKTNTKEVKSQTYTVKKGDTLTGIAKKLTGTSSNWKAIYNTNKKVIGSNPNKIYPGQKLVIKV